MLTACTLIAFTAALVVTPLDGGMVLRYQREPTAVIAAGRRVLVDGILLIRRLLILDRRALFWA
jgi:hypothetical protein